MFHIDQMLVTYINKNDPSITNNCVCVLQDFFGNHGTYIMPMDDIT